MGVGVAEGGAVGGLVGGLVGGFVGGLEEDERCVRGGQG